LESYSDLTGDVASLLTTPEACVAIDIANHIDTALEDNVLNTIKTEMTSFQELNVNGQSIWLQRLDQGMNIDTIQRLVQNSNFANNVYSETELEASQEIIQSNAAITDAIESLSRTVQLTTSITTDTIGQMLFILAMVLAGGLFIFVIVSAAKPKLAKKLLRHVMPEKQKK
jgi:hypothetical protein